jgi:hypothetical protein
MLPGVELAQKLLAAARSFLQHILIYYGFIGKDNILAALQIYQLLTVFHLQGFLQLCSQTLKVGFLLLQPVLKNLFV